MATIKSFTDLPQSKVLAEILPLESADMVYVHTVDLEGDEHYDIDFRNNQPLFEDDISAWSLAALIDIIENIDKSQKVEVSFTHNGGKYWVNVHFDEFGSFCQDYELYDSKIDALIAMINKFKNRNLL